MILRKQKVPTLVSVYRIWDHASHNAMTDLIRFNDKWFCVFRESDAHVKGSDGSIRIISSTDTLEWRTAALFSQEGVDLRDPKFSVTPNGKLMLLVGGTVYNEAKEYEWLQSRVAFSDDGIHWSPFTLILEPHEWLWRVTWFMGKAYGVSYSRSEPKDVRQEWHIKLFESSNGIDYTLVTQWEIKGHPNETTVRFMKNGEMVALVRRDGKKDSNAWLGYSQPPYTEWDWRPTTHYVGGPNFLVLPDETLWVAGRLMIECPYVNLEKTFVGMIENDEIQPLVVLPSGGDCSYPGMVYYDNLLWVSYYSSHQISKTSIYLARLAL
jgi:hypothetical protein